MSRSVTEETFNLALQHHQANRFSEAERLYREVLTNHPDHAQALHLLGVIALQTGQDDTAIKLIGQAISLNPQFPEAHNNLGIALMNKRQLVAAIAAHRNAILLHPAWPEAHFNLGNALKENGQFRDAIAAYRDAIRLRPEYAHAHNNLGSVFKDTGQIDQAIPAFQQAIALQPDFAQAHFNLGNTLKLRGEIDQAVSAYRQAISFKPDFTDAHFDLGALLKTKGDTGAAIAAFRAAISIDPNHALAHNHLGNALAEIGEPDDAIVAFRQALSLRPDMSSGFGNLLITMICHPAYDDQAIARELHNWSTHNAEPLRKFIRPHPNDPTPDRRLRIGYVSSEFRDRVVGRNLLPLFLRHDRQQFEIFCYAQVFQPDAMTAQFQQNADAWRDITGLSDEQAAEKIREDRIDLLIDLSLHTSQNRLLIFAFKPAPVQATFMGYPGTTGLSTIDYRLSDPHLDPPERDESIYSEKTIRLPDSFWCYDPLDAHDIQVNSLPAEKNGFIAFGCLNTFRKINDQVLDLWAQVLQWVENSRLLLLAHPGIPRQRTLNHLTHRGIDPARIEFTSYQSRRKYLETYHRIDIGLDTFPYNGHTTSLDSFWMGVPVVTFVGQKAVSRAGWCLLSNLGLPEFAGTMPQQFVKIAVNLANDIPALSRLRLTLRGRMQHSPLMNAPKFALDVETAFRKMWHAYCAAQIAKT